MNQYHRISQELISAPDRQKYSNLLSLVTRSNAPRNAASSDTFVKAMRGAATGVNIVTTDGDAGRFGVTVSAFASVSANPPAVLVCINKKSPACSAIRENGSFCVNVLSTKQRSLADIFAGFSADGDAYDFANGSWTKSDTGSPMLQGSVSNFDCRVGSAFDVGTHTILVGFVTSVEQSEASPLLYTNRSYRHASYAI